MATERYTAGDPRIGPGMPGESRPLDGGLPRGRNPRVWAKSLTVSLTIVYGVLTGCDPMGPGPELRFGLDGQVRVTVEVPLQGGVGWMQQVLTWNSDGAWKLYEEIGYDSVVGDDNEMRNPGLPYLYAANYASLLQLAIDNPGTRLGGLQDMDPDCGIGRTRVTILIRDNRRDEERKWTRCAFYANALGDLSTEGFEPDDGAARVIQIALRARDFTLGEDFNDYAHAGSLPFATIERGTQSGTQFIEGVVFRTSDGEGEGDEPVGWSLFWQNHTGGETPQPEIDWTRDMVVVAAIGMREEAGDSVEVRRVLLIGDENRVTGTKIEMVERIPGDYCAPASRIVWPYHIVLTPRGHPHPTFSLRAERIPCEA